MPRLTLRLPGVFAPIALALALFGATGLLPSTMSTASAADGDGNTRRALKLDEATVAQQQSEELRKLAETTRFDAISKLQALLREAVEGDRKAEMMLRLAYLYYEQGKSDFNAEMETYGKAYDACFSSATNPDDCDKIVEDHKKSFGWYDKAIKLYEAVLKGYPRYARADEATYYLGVTYKEENRELEAVESMKKLVKLYPTSTYVPDGYVYIGEYYFDHNEAFPALTAYKKAASYTEHPRYAYAMYKLAWCYFNVDEMEKGIETMKSVVAFSMSQSTTDKSGSVKLEEEALKDLVRFFAEAGEMEEAYVYFTKLGRKELIRETLKQLAAIFYDQGKFSEAVETYRRLIQEAPNHPENPVYQKSIVDAYKKIGQKDRVIEELGRLRQDYGKASAWAKANAANPDAITEADAKIEVALRGAATEFNKEARDFQKAKHPRMKEAFDSAVAAYQVYMVDYDKDKRSYEIHWDFAELLYELKRFEESYDQYLRVVDIDVKGEHSRDAAEAAIFASEAKVGTIKAESVKVTKDIQPIPLTEWEQRLVASCKRYTDLFPGDDSKIEAITYKSAFLLYQRFHFSEAAEQFRAVIKKWPNSQNAEFSAKLILGALEIREDWVAERDTAKSFWQTKELGSDAFRAEMYKVYRKTSLDVIQVNYETLKDDGKYADDLMGFYKEFPDYEESSALLNDVSVYYAKAGRVSDSMTVRTLLVEDPKFGPKTKYYYEQIGQLGFNYEQMADFDKATEYYDRLFALYPAEREKEIKARDAEKDATKKAEIVAHIATIDGQAADAEFTSAVFHTASGDWQGGIERFQAFIKAFPADDRVMDLHLRIANTYETQKQYDKAVTAFADFYKVQHKDADVDRAFYARLHQGRSLIALGKTAEATALYKESTDLYRKMKAGTPPSAWSSYAAEMMYFLVGPEYQAFTKLDLDTGYIKDPGSSGGSLDSIVKKDEKIVKGKLQAKVKALAELEKKYKEILDTGAGDWGMAGLVQLGQAYENMAQKLTTSPCPYYLTAEQCDFYSMGLEDAAFPQSQKAVDVYSLALEKAYELNLYNENTAIATRKLGDIRPDEFPGLHEELPKPGLTAEKTRSFDIEPSL
jgi:tetratricopeptide (TPR) repeat protein